MIEKMIRKYVENLRLEDIETFARENGIFLTKDESHYLYHIIQTKWEFVVFGSIEDVLKEAKSNLRPDTYKKVEELLYFYHEKYKRYL